MDYYGEQGWQAIDFIERYNLDFKLGNAVKYLFRAGKKTKSSVKDLSKAYWYLNRHFSKYQNLVLDVSYDDIYVYVVKGSLDVKFVPVIYNALNNHEIALLILSNIINNMILNDNDN